MKTLLCVLLVSLPPLFVRLGGGDCEFHMEVRALASSQDTWMRQQTDPRAWLIPSWNGQPRVNKPPLSVWLNLLAWSGLTPETSTVDQLVLRARALAASLLAIMLAAFCATASRLRGAEFGALAAAALGTSLLFLRQGRLATYDTHALALSGLCLCAGLWAAAPASPLSDRGRRRAWLAAGLFMGLALMAKGPATLVATALPLGTLAFLSSPRSRGAAGWLVAILAAAALALPWYVHVLRDVPAAAGLLLQEYRAERDDPQPVWYYLGLLGLVVPWSCWLVAGAIRAARAGGEARAWPDRVLLVVFVLMFVTLSIPAAKQQRYITVILPAAAWLIARGLAGGPAPTRGWSHAHGALLVVGSVAAGLAGAIQPWALQRRWLDTPHLVDLPAAAFVALGILLLLTATHTWRLLLRGRAGAAAWATATWMAVAATTGFYAYSDAPHNHYARRAEAERIAAVVAGQPFHYLTRPDLPGQADRPDPKFLLYTRRTIPAVSLDEALRPGLHGWLMVPRDDATDRALRLAGWERRLDFSDHLHARVLYRRLSVPPAAVTG